MKRDTGEPEAARHAFGRLSARGQMAELRGRAQPQSEWLRQAQEEVYKPPAPEFHRRSTAGMSPQPSQPAEQPTGVLHTPGARFIRRKSKEAILAEMTAKARPVEPRTLEYKLPEPEPEWEPEPEEQRGPKMMDCPKCGRRIHCKGSTLHIRACRG